MDLSHFVNMIKEVKSLYKLGWKIYKVRITIFKDGQYVVIGREGR